MRGHATDEGEGRGRKGVVEALSGTWGFKFVVGRTRRKEGQEGHKYGRQT